MSAATPVKRVVTLGYLVRDGALLMLRRPRPPNEGLWSPPGGKVEADESPEECLRREWAEETGLTPGRLELTGILSQYAPGHYDVVMFLFRVRGATGDLKEGDGGPLEWVPVAEIFDRPCPEADRRFTAWVLDDTLRFFRARFLQDEAGHVLDAVVYETIGLDPIRGQQA